ncbi:MAG: cysteine desulfurase NifS [Bacillota bacterium]
MRRVYLDHSATTPVHPRVAAVVTRYMLADYGNASSVHSFGREAHRALERARGQVAELIGAEDPREIIFTSGGTESDNLAIKGVARANRRRGNHIITSAVEHHAVLHTCDALEKEDFRVTTVGVDRDGCVDPGEVREAIDDETVLISIMLANNEIGTLQPVREIAGIAREMNVIVHTDAVQAAGQIPVNVVELGVDLMSLSGHKMYGPKGVGALYVRRGTRIGPTEHGGHHERNLRAGTENIPGIAGMGEACGVTLEELSQRSDHLCRLRDRFIEGLLQLDGVQLNGHRHRRLPNNVNVNVNGIEGEAMLLNLDAAGIAASSGSACTSGSLEASHVLLACGVEPERAHGSLRMTLGRDNSQEDVDYVLEVLPGIVRKLREMSPLA